jgi:hypothetical protein
MEGFFEEDVCFVEKDICDGMEPMVEEKEEQRTGASSEDKIDYPPRRKSWRSFLHPGRRAILLGEAHNNITV